MQSVFNAAAVEWLEYAIEMDMVAPDAVHYITAAANYCRKVRSFSALNDIFDEYISGIIIDSDVTFAKWLDMVMTQEDL